MRILMTSDGSTQAERTCRFAAQIARNADESLTVLTVLKHVADRSPYFTEEILNQARDLLEPDIGDMLTKVRVGRPAEEIVREAKEGDYGLVIVGKNHGSVTRFLGCSTALHVAAHAPCPVMIVKGITSPIRRILLCNSGADGSSALSRFTAQLVSLLEGKTDVTVLHVMSQMSAGPGVIGKQLRAGAEELIKEQSPEGALLERDVQALARHGIRARPRVRHGLVVEEILAEARDGDYDLVVIGAHRSKGWHRVLLDDQTHKIAHQLDRPVLVVR